MEAPNSEIVFNAMNSLLTRIGALLYRANNTVDQPGFVEENQAEIASMVQSLDSLMNFWEEEALRQGVRPEICADIQANLRRCKDALPRQAIYVN